MIDNLTYRTKHSYNVIPNREINTLVIHYTAANFSASVSTLTQGNVSAHYLVPDFEEKTYREKHGQEKKIFNLVDEENIAWHAGVSSWRGKPSINQTSIGIENINLATFANNVFHFPPYGHEQISELINLCKNILGRNKNIPAINVVAHSDISIGRKSDPGPIFPWKLLYDNGIGAWYDNDCFVKYQEKFRLNLPTTSEFINRMQLYGYDVNCGATLDNIIRAFQLHFMPTGKIGLIDIDTAAALYALTDKYV